MDKQNTSSPHSPKPQTSQIPLIQGRIIILNDLSAKDVSPSQNFLQNILLEEGYSPSLIPVARPDSSEASQSIRFTRSQPGLLYHPHAKRFMASIQEDFSIICVSGTSSTHINNLSAALLSLLSPDQGLTFENLGCQTVGIWVFSRLLDWTSADGTRHKKVLLLSLEGYQSLDDDKDRFNELFAFCCMISTLMIWVSPSGVAVPFSDASWKEMSDLATFLQHFSHEEQNERNWLNNSPIFLYAAVNHAILRSLDEDDSAWEQTKKSRTLSFLRKFKELFGTTFDNDCFLSLPADTTEYHNKLKLFVDERLDSLLPTLMVTNMRDDQKETRPVTQRFDEIAENFLDLIQKKGFKQACFGPNPENCLCRGNQRKNSSRLKYRRLAQEQIPRI